MTRREIVFVLVTVVSGVAAHLSSHAIYYQEIVPRLPTWQAVPLTWWFVMFSPLLVVALWAGIVVRKPQGALLHALAAVVPTTLIDFVPQVARHGFFGDYEIGHDMWGSALDYWVADLPQIILWTLLIGLTHLLLRLLRRGARSL